MAALLDSKFKIPGTDFRFGLDPVIGLIPGVGDAVTLVMSGLLGTHLLRKGASGNLVAKITVNIVLDTIIGVIPVIGQIFDFFYRSNERNIRLVREYHYEGKHQGSGFWIWFAAISLVVFLVVLIVWAFIKVVEWLGEVF